MVFMQVGRYSVTMEPALGVAVRDAAERAGTSVSSRLAQAAADRLLNDLLGAALDAWEAQDRPFGDEELDAAAATLCCLPARVSSIQIKNVPDEVRLVYRRRAAAAGQSLQEYLLAELIENTGRPTPGEVLDRAGARAGGRLPASFAVEHLRAERDSR